MFLWFLMEICVLLFWPKSAFFAVLTCFGEKLRITGLAESCIFAVLVENIFCGFGRKSVFDEKCVFAILAGKYFFMVLAENTFFLRFNGKYFLRF